MSDEITAEIFARATEAAATAAAKVVAQSAIDAAAVLATQSAVTSQASIQLEHRLTEIEAGIRLANNSSEARHNALALTLGEIKGTVQLNNGRIGKLENWKGQIMALVALGIFAQPLVLWALTQR